MRVEEALMISIVFLFSIFLFCFYNVYENSTGISEIEYELEQDDYVDGKRIGQTLDYEC